MARTFATSVQAIHELVSPKTILSKFSDKLCLLSRVDNNRYHLLNSRCNSNADFELTRWGGEDEYEELDKLKMEDT